jgi:ABC-type branched-subunit amino acid transport system substrate-binding protein
MKRRKLLTLAVGICLAVIMAFLSLMSACPSPAPEPPAPQPPTPQLPTPQPPEPEVKTLQIGANMSLLGWFSGGDMLQMQGLELARDMINERGGIDIKGQKYLIELVVEDNKSAGDGTAAACTKLIHDQNIKFMVGASAFMAAAAAPICEPARVLRSLSASPNYGRGATSRPEP